MTPLFWWLENKAIMKFYSLQAAHTELSHSVAQTYEIKDFEYFFWLRESVQVPVISELKKYNDCPILLQKKVFLKLMIHIHKPIWSHLFLTDATKLSSAGWVCSWPTFPSWSYGCTWNWVLKRKMDSFPSWLSRTCSSLRKEFGICIIYHWKVLS